MLFILILGLHIQEIPWTPFHQDSNFEDTNWGICEYYTTNNYSVRIFRHIAQVNHWEIGWLPNENPLHLWSHKFALFIKLDKFGNPTFVDHIYELPWKKLTFQLNNGQVFEINGSLDPDFQDFFRILKKYNNDVWVSFHLDNQVTRERFDFSGLLEAIEIGKWRNYLIEANKFVPIWEKKVTTPWQPISDTAQTVLFKNTILEKGQLEKGIQYSAIPEWNYFDLKTESGDFSVYLENKAIIIENNPSTLKIVYDGDQDAAYSDIQLTISIGNKEYPFELSNEGLFFLSDTFPKKLYNLKGKAKPMTIKYYAKGDQVVLNYPPKAIELLRRFIKELLPRRASAITLQRPY